MLKSIIEGFTRKENVGFLNKCIFKFNTNSAVMFFKKCMYLKYTIINNLYSHINTRIKVDFTED